MAKFDDFDLHIDNSLKIIKVKGKDINIKQYIPAEEKNSILENVLQQADQGVHDF